MIKIYTYKRKTINKPMNENDDLENQRSGFPLVKTKTGETYADAVKSILEICNEPTPTLHPTSDGYEFVTLEKEDGTRATKEDISRHNKGEVRLYDCLYRFIVECDNFQSKELKQALKKARVL